MCGCLSSNPHWGSSLQPRDWESNQQPFGSQACAQSTEPHQPGLTEPLEPGLVMEKSQPLCLQMWSLSHCLLWGPQLNTLDFMTPDSYQLFYIMCWSLWDTSWKTSFDVPTQECDCSNVNISTKFLILVITFFNSRSSIWFFFLYTRSLGEFSVSCRYFHMQVQVQQEQEIVSDKSGFCFHFSLEFLFFRLLLTTLLAPNLKKKMSVFLLFLSTLPRDFRFFLLFQKTCLHILAHYYREISWFPPTIYFFLISDFWSMDIFQLLVC